MGLTLQANHVVFLDTAPFIYFFEEHEKYFSRLADFFDSLYTVRAQAVTSVITYIELATLPARAGNRQLVRKYRDYLLHSENLALYALDMNIADQVIDLRARYGFKTPDAIQLGTALACGADFVLTNDRSWKRLAEKGMTVLLVEELDGP